MFACQSCAPSCQPSGACLDVVGSLGRPLHDPLWNEIQADALIEADREPLLRPLIEQAVTWRKTFGDGIAMMLVRRLGDGGFDESALYDEFRDIIARDATIIQSARNDLLAIRRSDPATTNLLNPFLHFKGFHAIQAYRVAHALWSSGRRGLALHLQNRASMVLGVDIHPAARIGAGVFVDHATGVVVGETAVIGEEVTILHGVTLGGTGKDEGDRHPKVGRGVFIGAGAQLLGNIEIGEGARIGAGSVVLGDVAADTTVAGVPARVVRRSTIPLSSPRRDTGTGTASA